MSFGKSPIIEPLGLTLQNILSFFSRRGSEEKDIKTRILAEEVPRTWIAIVKKKSRIKSWFKHPQQLLVREGVFEDQGVTVECANHCDYCQGELLDSVAGGQLQR